MDALPAGPDHADQSVRFVKQYGALRTGTNLVRTVLSERFPDLKVLIHTLGDKHSAPTGLVRGVGDYSGRSALELVTEATMAAPAATTDLADPLVRKYLEEVAEELISALRTGRVRYVVSIKDPYAWLSSLLRYAGWLPRWVAYGRGGFVSPELRRTLRAACQSFNDCYRDWSRLIEGPPCRGVVVRWEQLVASPGHVLEALDACVAGKPAPGRGDRLPEGVVTPTHWDYSPTRTVANRFDHSYYSQRRYLTDLGPDVRGIVTANMDWTLLAQWGYQPERG